MGTVPVFPTFAPLEIPSAAKLNQMRDAVAFLQNPPKCLAIHSATQSIPNNNAAWDAVLFGSEVYDIVQSGDTASHDNTTNPGRIYFRTSGKYVITAQISFASNATGARSMQIRSNSGGLITGGAAVQTNKQGAVSGVSTSVFLSTVPLPFTAGDYIEMFCSQTSGGALSTISGADVSFMGIKFDSA